MSASETDDVEALTTVAQDYLKAVWSATEWGGEPMTTSRLAARFGTSPASVTDTVRRLAARGLVVHVPYRPVALTEEGRRLAVQMVRRHRLLETFLVDELGYDWAEVHDDAERLEHAVSERLLDRIDERLGHPASDPHGDPIPDRHGRMVRPDEAVVLSDAEPGRFRVVRVSDADPAHLDAAAALGIRPGSVLDVDGGSVVSGVGDRSIRRDDPLAAAVLVAPVA